MTAERPYDVCIVGAGLAGALIASELSRLPIGIVMLDAGRRFPPALRLELMRRP